MIKEERNKNNLLIQIICDSKGCREVDIFDKPIEPNNSELKTLMSPKQLKELADRETKTMTRKEQIMDAAMYFAKKNENTPIPYLDFVEAVEWADRTMIDKMIKWLETINFEKDYIDRTDYGGCFFKEEDFINDFRKVMEK